MLVVFKPHQVAQISWLFFQPDGSRGRGWDTWLFSVSLALKLVSSLFSSLSAVIIEVRPVKMIEDFISFPSACPAGRES